MLEYAIFKLGLHQEFVGNEIGSQPPRYLRAHPRPTLRLPHHTQARAPHANDRQSNSGGRWRLLVERFQISNHMGPSKVPQSAGRSLKLRLSGFMELVVWGTHFGPRSDLGRGSARALETADAAVVRHGNIGLPMSEMGQQANNST